MGARAGITFCAATGKWEVAVIVKPGTPAAFSAHDSFVDAMWTLLRQGLRHVRGNAQLEGGLEIWETAATPTAAGLEELERNVEKKRRTARVAQLDLEAAELVLATARTAAGGARG